MHENRRKLSFTLVGGLVFVILVVCVTLMLFLWFSTTRIPRVILPNPNAYDHFVEAGTGVGVTPNIAEASAEEFGEFVQKHASALRQIREALSYESCVPIDYERGFLDEELDRLSPLRQSIRLLFVAGRLDEEQGTTSEAADTYLDVVRMSRAASKGGLMVHVLVDVGHERMA